MLGQEIVCPELIEVIRIDRRITKAERLIDTHIGCWIDRITGCTDVILRQVIDPCFYLNAGRIGRYVKDRRVPGTAGPNEGPVCSAGI